MPLLKLLFFNSISRWTLTLPLYKYLVKKSTERSLPLVREVMYFTSVMFTLFFFYFIVLMIIKAITGNDPQSEFAFKSMWLILGVATLNKDLINGQSPVHRVMGWRVVDARSSKPASAIQCMLRNITFPLFLFEYLILQGRSGRRFGDAIAGTKLARVAPSQPDLIFTELGDLKGTRDVVVAIIISIIATVLILFPIFIQYTNP